VCCGHPWPTLAHVSTTRQPGSVAARVAFARRKSIRKEDRKFRPRSVILSQAVAEQWEGNEGGNVHIVGRKTIRDNVITFSSDICLCSR
jgi:hypothetical protein